MDHEANSPRQGWDSLLPVMLTLLLGGGILAFLIFVSFGYFFYVAVAALGIAAVGYCHYLLWGQGAAQDGAREASGAARETPDGAPGKRPGV
jgi:hypothetical protein